MSCRGWKEEELDSEDPHVGEEEDEPEEFTSSNISSDSEESLELGDEEGEETESSAFLSPLIPWLLS